MAPCRLALSWVCLWALCLWPTLSFAESPVFESNIKERRSLCVFVPISPRSRKDTVLAHVAVETWASPEAQRTAGPEGARVYFLSPPGSEVFPALAAMTVQLPDDVDTDYAKLPLRTFAMWKTLGQEWENECNWFMKADADSYVNLAAVAARLQCFESTDQHYFGVTHAIMPPAGMRDHFPATFFAHGGSGYIVSQGLIGYVGYWATPCLMMTLNATQGDAMEDVAFALCLRNQGVEVMNYGYMASEFIVNFHQARRVLLNTTVTYTPSPYWDVQAPALSPCLLVIHPVEAADDLRRVHEQVYGSFSGISRACAITATKLAKQSETRLHAHGGMVKWSWAPEQLPVLHQCFQPHWPNRGMTCEWQRLEVQCHGLSQYMPAKTPEDCEAACCASPDCLVYQFRLKEGCWIGEDVYLDTEAAIVDEADVWTGGMKSFT